MIELCPTCNALMLAFRNKASALAVPEAQLLKLAEAINCSCAKTGIKGIALKLNGTIEATDGKGKVKVSGTGGVFLCMFKGTVKVLEGEAEPLTEVCLFGKRWRWPQKAYHEPEYYLSNFDYLPLWDEAGECELDSVKPVWVR